MTLQLTLDNTTLLEALRWRDENPTAYATIVRWARRDAIIHGRCFMQAYLEALRSPSIAHELGLRRDDDEPFLVNNNIKAALTRLVLTEHPGLPFRPRRSKCDPTSATN